MNKLAALLAVAVFVVALGWFWFGKPGAAPEVPGENANTFVPTLTTPAGLGLKYDQSLYGLATKPEQVLVESYIPPCDSDFDYCLYYQGNDYAGTNFDSAGVRIKARTDLTERQTCLTTLPAGYTELSPKVRDVGEAYATSLFWPLGDAGAGHYTTGVLYRLTAGTTCYEFEVRLGESQFANYPAGSIKRFTETDRDVLFAELVGIVGATRLEGVDEYLIYPVRD